MNENSSKQVLLSVLGIAVLVVAVVGVSFAFFTYSKAGEKNNTLTTGSIFFNFTEGTALYLTNQFPVTDTQAQSLTVGDGESDVLDFSVVGYDTSATGIDYTVTATTGGAVDGRTERLNDSGIKLLLTAVSSNGSAITNNFATAKAVGNDGDLANGVVLATGKITATAEAQKQTDAYELRMWISSDYVSINENETAGDGDNVYTAAEFGELYYSLRVDVTAESSDATPGADLTD